jgi:ABC-type arginine transport system permease subunit
MHASSAEKPPTIWALNLSRYNSELIACLGVIFAYMEESRQKMRELALMQESSIIRAHRNVLTVRDASLIFHVGSDALSHISDVFI